MSLPPLPHGLREQAESPGWQCGNIGAPAHPSPEILVRGPEPPARCERRQRCAEHEAHQDLARVVARRHRGLLAGVLYNEVSLPTRRVKVGSKQCTRCIGGSRELRRWIAFECASHLSRWHPAHVRGHRRRTLDCRGDHPRDRLGMHSVHRWLVIASRALHMGSMGSDVTSIHRWTCGCVVDRPGHRITAHSLHRAGIRARDAQMQGMSARTHSCASRRMRPAATG